VFNSGKRNQQKMAGPTLQEFELIPVTDPADEAALDRRRAPSPHQVSS
jgi:hypothetical protein